MYGMGEEGRGRSMECGGDIDDYGECYQKWRLGKGNGGSVFRVRLCAKIHVEVDGTS
jgi:hypothetical protein